MNKLNRIKSAVCKAIELGIATSEANLLVRMVRDDESMIIGDSKVISIFDGIGVEKHSFFV